MIDAKQLEIEGEIRETHWVMDEAVDLGQSDLTTWVRDGSGLMMRPGVKPSLIRWRPLGDRERFAASRLANLNKNADGDVDERAVISYMHECARFGLLDFDGIPLGRAHYFGVKGISDESMRVLDRLKVPKEPTDANLERVKDLRFLTWIGGLILDASFRDGN